MTLHDRQTLTFAGCLLADDRPDVAGSALQDVSNEARRSSEYRDLDAAVTMVTHWLSKGASPPWMPGCDHESVGCWWTCPSDVRRSCEPSAGKFWRPASAEATRPHRVKRV